MIKNLLFALFIVSLFAFNTSCRKSDYRINSGSTTITDNGSGTGTVTWTSDKVYYLDGLVFVNNGQTLNIEAGTIIKAKTGQTENASALIITRGGKIIAEGTAEKPIIFTVEGDDLEGSVPLFSKGLWGGIIILGNARLNTSAGEASVEGIPISEPRGIYGGSDDEDNSGIIKYVSIRHGGTNIGEGNEINGLTLGGVGSGTEIDFVEIISNKDDGIECFGGTVNLKHIVVAFCGDDCFDFDDGFRGNGQFWLAIQDPNDGDLISEHDGGSDPINGIPFSIPYIYNGTFIGRGNSITNNLIVFRENAGGIYANSIFINQGKGINIEYNSDNDNSYERLMHDDLQIKNNAFYNISGNQENDVLNVFSLQTIDIDSQNSGIDDYFEQADNLVDNPGLPIEEDYYHIIPLNSINGINADYLNDWFDKVDYKGAFGHYNWANNWTLLSQSGYIE